MRERVRFQRELAQLNVREFDVAVAPSTSDIDEAAAQPLFPDSVRDKVGSLLGTAALKSAIQWNAANHPAQSGVDMAAIDSRLARYVNRSAIEQEMRNSPTLKDRAGDDAAVRAAMAHQFQQKIYADQAQHDGKIGEGTLDALGFVSRRGLNRVDAANHRYHSGQDGAGKSAAYQRLESVYRTHRAEFQNVAPDLTPATWYLHFVNAPFLGRPFRNGIHLELIRRLRVAEARLNRVSVYASMSPVELGAALGVDEDHGGGRMNSKSSSSMHTFGLAADIGYIKNPWVAGQEGSSGRNSRFRAVSINVSRLLHGTSHELTPAWLDGLGTDPNRTTESAFDAIHALHRDSIAYLRLENDAAALEAAIVANGLVRPGETAAQAVSRWRTTIRADRAKLQSAYGSDRRPANGFLNLHRDLVIALRDTGCLAWGAIDIGASQSGDMMHFDCRAAGIGRLVKPDSGHAVVRGHPCLGTGTAREREYDVKQPRPFTVQPWVFEAQTIAMKVAVFVSSAAQRSDGWELLVYAHGHNTCSPIQKNMPLSFLVDPPFRLAETIEASGRPMIVAVPFFDWENLVKNRLAMGKDKPRNQWHQIGQPKILNGVANEILAEAGKKAGHASVRLIRLLLAGHSGAYGFFDPLADAYADPQMSSGALAKLSHVWCFDTSYSCPGTRWKTWLASANAPAVSMFYGGHSKTIWCGDQFKSLMSSSNGKLFALRVVAAHCEIPNLLLPYLLKWLR